MRILVVDDEKIKRVTLADDLSGQGHEVVTAGRRPAGPGTAGPRAVRRRRDRPQDAQARRHGIAQAHQAGPARPTSEVILMTAYGSIPVAVEAMKLGAFDFVTKPFRNEDLFPLIRRIAQERQEAARRAGAAAAEGPAEDDDRPRDHRPFGGHGSASSG